MAMLAEPRQRRRYNLVPRGKALYEDKCRFGTKMLEKMGWQKDKGLGANEDGSKDFVRIRYKNDALGLGYKHHDDQWTQHEQSFNGLLKSLNNEEELEGSEINKKKVHESEDDMPRIGFQEQIKPKMEKLKEKTSGVSLEERSKQSRARVHYKKFTKGKDLAQYSEKDLANIFGKKAADDQQAANDFYTQLSNSFEKKQANTSNDGEEEKPIKGVQIINTGVSVNDYFKTKMEALKKQRNGDTEIVYNGQQLEDETKKNKKMKKDKKNQDEEEDNESENKDGQMLYSEVSVTDYFKMKAEAIKNRRNISNDTDAMKDTKTTTDEIKEEVTKKKKKSKKEKNVNGLDHPVDNEKKIDSHEAVTKKDKYKKRDEKTTEIYLEGKTKTKNKKDKTKRKKHEDVEPQNEIDADLPNENLTIKKRKHENLPTDNTVSPDPTECNIEIDLIQEPAKKKHKKSKNKESTETIEIDSDSDKETTTISKNEPNKEEKKKSEKSKEATDSLEEVKNATNSNQTEQASAQTSKKPSKKSKSKKDVSSSAKTVFISDNVQLLDLDELKKKYTSFNIYPISSFCAEKFRNISLNDFTGSILPQIVGYGLGPDLKLDIQINKYDEERITNLWKCVLNKYVHLEKPKKTYQRYVREVIKARKAKQKRPKLYVKTWKRKNAFHVI